MTEEARLENSAYIPTEDAILINHVNSYGLYT